MSFKKGEHDDLVERIKRLELGPGKKIDPSEQPRQEQLPSGVSANERARLHSYFPEDARRFDGLPVYDYSHHLPEDSRAAGYRILGGPTPWVGIPHATWLTAPDGTLIGSKRAEQEPLGRQSGWNLTRDARMKALASEPLENAATNALSQHLQLAGENRLGDIKYAPPPAPLDVSEGKAVDPRSIAQPEGPLRISNPYIGKNKTPRTAKLVGHGPAVRDPVFQLPLGNAQAYDYSHHLSPEERSNGYKLTMYHWPSTPSENSRVLGTVPTQAGYSFLSTTHNGKGIGSGHHFESDENSLRTRTPIMSRLADEHENRQNPYGGVFAAGQRAFKQHRDLAWNRELPTTTLSSRAAGLEIDQVAKKARAKRKVPQTSLDQALADRAKWLEIGNQEPQGLLEQRQAAKQAEEDARAAAEATRQKETAKAQAEKLARQQLEDRRNTPPTFLKGFVEKDNPYNRKYEADYTHHLPDKLASKYQLIVRNGAGGYQRYSPEAVLIRRTDGKEVANRGGAKGYNKWKGTPIQQEALTYALRQHTPMFEALTQAKPGDKLVPTQVKPGREMPPEEWHQARANKNSGGWGEGRTLGERYRVDETDPEETPHKMYDYSHLLPEQLGGYKLWIAHHPRTDNLYTHVIDPSGRSELPFESLHTYPNLAQNWIDETKNIGGGFRPYVQKALHDHGRWIEDTKTAAEAARQAALPGPDVPGPRILSISPGGADAMVRYNHHLPEDMRDTHRLAVYHNRGLPWASVETRGTGRAEATRGLHGRNIGPYQNEMAAALAEHGLVADQLRNAKQGEILRVPAQAAPTSEQPALPPAIEEPVEEPPAPRPSEPAAESSPDEKKAGTFESRWGALELSEKNMDAIDLLKKEASHWLGRPIADAQHGPLLEQSAGVYEFGHKLPRSQAEDKAYEDYKKDQRTEAAAFHLKGLKAAQGAGDREAAKKHGIMYAIHCKALGHEPVGQPHPSILARMEKHPDKLYRFKAHRGDLFALPDGDKGEQDPTKEDK